MKNNQDEALERVAQHYKDNIQYQLSRLENDSPVEYAITLRKLDRWINSGDRVADIGTGAGHYALHLANKQCYLHLIDIADDLLNVCHQKFIEANCEQYIINTSNTSATDLGFIPDESVDAVMMLGPLYHLTKAADRDKALQEAHRILKKEGIILAGGINRLAVLKELWNVERFSMLKEMTPPINTIQKELLAFINTGESNKTVFFPLANAFFATGQSFKEELLNYFSELEFSGVESFAGHVQHEFFNKEDNLKSAWLDLIEITGKTSEGIAAAEHFLFIGKKG